MSLRNALLRIGFLDLNKSRMERLFDESNESMICWAFDNGLYDIRRMVVEYFIQRESAQAHSILHRAMNDEVEIISQEAMIGLESFSVGSETIQEIAEKRNYWKEENAYLEKRRNRKHVKKSVFTDTKERGSKKTLDNVRNMLKKPMLGGKWF